MHRVCFRKLPEKLLPCRDWEWLSVLTWTRQLFVRYSSSLIQRLCMHKPHDSDLPVHATGWLVHVSCEHHLTRLLLLLQGLSLATHLHFEFYSEANADSGESPGLQVIDVPRLDQHPGNDHEIFCQLVMQYKVPEAIRYCITLYTHFLIETGLYAQHSESVICAKSSWSASAYCTCHFRIC